MRLVPTTRPHLVVTEVVHWNYTTILNIVAADGFAILCWLYCTRECQHRFTADPDHYTPTPGLGTDGPDSVGPEPVDPGAIDPVCGMTVNPAIALFGERDRRMYRF